MRTYLVAFVLSLLFAIIVLFIVAIILKTDHRRVKACLLSFI